MLSEKKLKKNKTDTLCLDCEKCTGACSWSREFKPVKGSKYVKTLLKIERERTLNTIIVLECPLFAKTPSKPWETNELTKSIAERLNIKTKTCSLYYFTHYKKCIKALKKARAYDLIELYKFNREDRELTLKINKELGLSRT